MRKPTLLAMTLAAALPLAALAQGGGPSAGPQGQGPGAAQSGPGARFSPEKLEKRMRLARTLGLAEALDLDAPAALKLGETIGKFDERRVAARKSMHEAKDVLRRAAKGEKVSAAEVDAAIQKGLEARAQITAIDRETVAAVTQGLSPEKKARAVLFLSKFQRRFAGPGGGHPDHGMGPGGMRGAGRHGEWRGQGGHGGPVGMAPPPPGPYFDDEPED